MNEEEQAIVQQHFERMQRELVWMRQAMLQADTRDEYMNLMESHFELLKKIGFLMLGLIEAMSSDDFEKYKTKIDPILDTLKELTPHSLKFQEIYERIPNRFDTLLATVDTPPHSM